MRNVRIKIMGRTLAVLVCWALVQTASAFAMSCTTQTYILNGKITTCQTCCTWGNCTTMCF